MAQYILDILTDYWFWGSLGFLLGSVIAFRNLMKIGISFPVCVIMTVTGIYFAMFGTRILWIALFMPEMFKENLPLALAFWQQTGTWLGAAVTGGVGSAIVLRICRKPVWEGIGSWAPALPLAHGIARVGCLFAGCCYGAPTSVPWAIYSTRLNTMVHPAPAYSILGEFFSLIILQTLWVRKPNVRKYLYPLYILLLSVHRFISEFFRGDPDGPQILAGLRVYQSVCIYLFALSLVTLILLKWKKKGLIAAACVILAVAGITFAMQPKSETQLRKRLDASNLYLVLTRSMFENSLQPWIELREQQGFSVLVKAWKQPPTARQMHDWIREQTKTIGTCRYILIVGDSAAEQNAKTNWHIPTVRIGFNSKIGQRFYVTDAPFADLDSDHLPDVPIGRLPVRDQLQLHNQIEKIHTYRNRTLSPDWYRSVLWVGAKGYTEQMNQIAQSLLPYVPKWLPCYYMSADTKSVYSGILEDQPQQFLKQLQNPAMLYMVASHGSYRSLTLAEEKKKEIFFSVEDGQLLRDNPPSGLLLMLSCDAGRFTTSESEGPGLAETCTLQSGGPICTVSATAKTNPITNLFLALELIDQLNKFPKTVGDYWLTVQRNVAQGGKKSLVQIAQNHPMAAPLLTAIPQSEYEALTVPKLAFYEMLSYNLLGDPASELKMPTDMPLLVTAETKNEITLHGKCKHPGSQLSVELIPARPARSQLPPDVTDAQRMQIFNQMNPEPKLLLTEKLETIEIKVDVNLPPDYFESKEYLRTTAIGNGQVGMSLHGAHGKTPFEEPAKQ